MNFGFLFLSRAVHDYAFGFYGNILGIDPATIGPLVMRACIIDSALIFSIYGFRKRREIAAWWAGFGASQRLNAPEPQAGRAPPAE
jgi:hypothetical protein